MTRGRVVRRIDHLAIATDDARRVFELLRDRLALDVLTPVTEVPAATAAAWYPVTSWLNLGNMPLEVLEPGVTLPPGPLEVNGLVFEPEPIESAVAELDRRGIPHPPPNPFFHPEDLERPIPDLGLANADGPKAGSLHGTQLFFQGFLGGKTWVLGYEWAATPVSVMREVLRRRLEEMPDRPLPIDGVAEVVTGATDLEAERGRWRTLLDPVTDDEPGTWRFDDGPALRLVEHDRDGIVGLVLRVTDVERAERYLKERDMLASSAGELVVPPEALDGLNLTLIG